eukprot:5795022-Prymnesium_polylepis.1
MQVNVGETGKEDSEVRRTAWRKIEVRMRPPDTPKLRLRPRRELCRARTHATTLSYMHGTP